jgi:topoisomerase-4 subunit B
MWFYVYLNAGLTINFNGNKYFSKNGLLDLLDRKTNAEEIKYPIIHLKDGDIEMAITHDNHYGEDYYSFVNGQNTTQGGTHVAAFKEALVRTVRDFYGKSFEPTDIRASLVSAISVRIQEPVFESQTKTKLGSTEVSPGGASLKTEINQFVKAQLDNFLHKNPEVADALLRKIQQSERERKDMAGVRKIARDRAKKASVHNKKLRDCRVHFTDEKKDNRLDTTLFITEGDSASGSITKARDVQTQAVFSLRGKPLNCFGLKKKIVYENEEFNLLQHALKIEESIDDLRYNKVVIATDADVDGMHIRLLILTFFLQFFPDLVRKGHVYILETPLFRVRNKKNTHYCYTDQERFDAINELGKSAEITRFKGLGEISPDEFGAFIGEDIRLEPVLLTEDSNINKILEYYMGKNTQERQKFIISNLRLEIDEAGQEEEVLIQSKESKETEAA